MTSRALTPHELAAAWDAAETRYSDKTMAQGRFNAQLLATLRPRWGGTVRPDFSMWCLLFTRPGETGYTFTEQVEVEWLAADKVKMALVQDVPRRSLSEPGGRRVVTGDFTRPENAVPAVEALLWQLGDPDADVGSEASVPGDVSGQRCLAQVRAGDRDAFAEMFSTHVQVVHRYCARRCDDVNQAEDLTSVVFLEAWRFRGRAVLVDGSLRPWLLAIAHNVVRNANRSRRRYRAALLRLHALPLVHADDHANTVATELDAAGVRDELAAAIAGLTDNQREVVELCLVEQLSPAAAAQVLGVPEGTVKSRLADARTRLRQLLGPSEVAFLTDPDDGSGHRGGERHSGAPAGRTSSWTR